jgi:hypothetical protein
MIALPSSVDKIVAQGADFADLCCRTQLCREAMVRSTRKTAIVTLRRSTEPFWARYSDEALLDVRMCDLGVVIAETRLEQDRKSVV